MPALIDRIGQKFGRLTVIARDHAHGAWECRCDCGNMLLVEAVRLTTGNTKSCGCYRVDRGREHGAHIRLTHGHARDARTTKLYRTWGSMIQRCTNPRHPQWPDYGGRGIVVCDRWRHDFEAFATDMGPKPTPAHSLDRIDNNGPYAPDNCRWATSAQQNTNTRGNRRITVNGRTEALAAWLRELGMIERTFYHRVARGMSDEQALTVPVRPKRRRAVR